MKMFSRLRHLLLVVVVPTSVSKTFCEQQVVQAEHASQHSEQADVFQSDDEDYNDDTRQDVSELVSEYFTEDDEYRYESQWYPNPMNPLPTCDSPSTNARGQYTSNLAPCTFTFHAVAANSTTTQKSDDDFEMATVCNTNNGVSRHTMVDYVHRWPDECVGDFARCYSVDDDKDVYLRHACKRKWNVPNGTTHFTVNCTADKTAKETLTQQQMTQDGEVIEPYQKQQIKMLHEVEIAAIVAGVAVFLLCVACCYMGHRWWVVPYQESLRSRRQESLDLVPAAETVPLDENENYHAGGARVV